MATWMIQGTDKKEEMTEDGYRRLNVARNKEKALKDKAIAFVDDLGKVYKDVHNLTDAREAGLLAKEKEKPGGGPHLDFPSSFCGLSNDLLWFAEMRRPRASKC